MFIYILGIICQLIIGIYLTIYFFKNSKEDYWFAIIIAIFTIMTCTATIATFLNKGDFI